MARAVGFDGAATESSRSRITASAAEAIAFVIFRSELPGANKGLRSRMRMTSRIEGGNLAPPATICNQRRHRGPYTKGDVRG